MRSPRRHLPRLLSLWLVAAPFLLAVLAMTGGRGPSPAALLNSDALYLPALVQDVSAGGALSRWFLTPAPYFFPDMLLFWPVGLLSSSALQAQQSYAILQVLLFATVTGVVGMLVGGRRAGVLSFALTAALVAPVVAAGADVFAYLALSGHHAGAFLAGVAGLVILMLCPLGVKSAVRGRRVRLREAALLAGLTLLTAASTLSDGIFVIQFTLPAVAALLILALLGAVRWMWFGLAAAALGLGHLVGNWLYPYTVIYETRSGYEVSFGFERVAENLAYAEHLGSELFRAYPWAAALLVLGHGSALLALLTVRVWYKRLPARGARLAALWCLWSVASSCALLLALIAVETPGPSARYLVGVALAATATLALGLALVVHMVIRTAPAAVLLVPALLIGSTAAVLTSPSTFSAKALEDRAACIQQAVADAPVPRGLANYWVSKQVYSLTGADVVTASVSRDLRPLPVIASSDWFRPPFGFLLVTPGPASDAALEVQTLNAQGVGIRARFDCADTAVVVLDEPFTPAGWRAEP